MKILKIFGVVMAIHFFAFVLIFANPGCSSTKKAATSDEAAEAPPPAEPAPAAAEPSPYYSSGAVTLKPVASEPASEPIPFDPDALATNTPRYTPTRPGTPAAAVVQPMPEPEVTPVTVYTVTRNDNLWNIAKKHGITVPELARANNLRVDVAIQPGQKLIIPGDAPSGLSTTAPAQEPARAAALPSPAPTETASRPASGSATHIVRPNETLSAIAKKYGVRVGDIAVANNITNPALIRPGMTLMIPGAQAPKRSEEPAPVAKAPAPQPAQPRPANPPPSSIPSIDVSEPPPPPPSGNIPVIRVEEQPRGF